MGVETTNTIAGLNANWPETGDPRSQGDDHIRLLKAVLKNCFPKINGQVTKTAAELNSAPSKASEIVSLLGFNVVQQGTGEGQDGSVPVKIGWDGTKLTAAVQVNGAEVALGKFFFGDAAVTGVGEPFPSNFYYTFPNGLILQGARVQATGVGVNPGSESGFYWGFPHGFPNSVTPFLFAFPETDPTITIFTDPGANAIDLNTPNDPQFKAGGHFRSRRMATGTSASAFRAICFALGY